MVDCTHHILVVDDAPDFLGFMETLLTSEGYAVEVAQSAQALREQLALRRPDLVIADVRMPGLEAFAVLDVLAEDAKTWDIPVLLCTGAVQEVDQAAERLKRDRIDVLFKPFDIDELLGHIARRLRGKGSSAVT